MDIIAVWNKAKQHLTYALPDWLQTLQRSIVIVVKAHSAVALP
jgi:cbb3-type cytochrome oxidase subunit 1